MFVYNLLIVDDEEHVRSQLTKGFPWHKYGLQVTGACRNGLEALDVIHNSPVHVVLTDLKMPRMDGLELAARIQQSFPRIHVFLLSAYNEFEFARRAIKTGVRGYLVKPADEEEVEELFGGIAEKLSAQMGEADMSSPHAERPSHGSYEKSFVSRAKQYVKDHIEQKISLQEVAKELYFTSAHFSASFKKETGQNFIDYVNQVKLEKAKELLRNSDYLVKEIAILVGYDDYTYFCKIFRKYEGHTPLNYRSEQMRS